MTTATPILNLTPTQLAELTRLKTLGQYPDMYRYLKTQVDIAIQNEVSTSARYEDLGILSNWLQNAAAINANDGSFKSEFVRGAVDTYSLWQNGTGISNQRFQDASDKLARDVYERVSGLQGILSADDIIKTDVKIAVDRLGLVDTWGWAGTLGDLLPTWLGGLGKDMVSIDKDASLLNYLAETAQVFAANAGGAGRVMGSKLMGFLNVLPDPVKLSLGGIEALINELQNLFQSAFITDPIILDLNGDGVQTTRLTKSSTSGVHFNLDAKGFAENTAWVDARDGLLVRDLNSDGKITSGRELFGNFTLLKNGNNAANGFEALKELDGNSDGVVDSQDVAFNTLKVWKDLDSDGITDTGELLTLNQGGVKNLKVAYTQSNVIDAQGNAHAQLGGFTTTDGITRNMDDVWFTVDTARTQEGDLVAVSADIAALPDVAHMGNVHSLHQAMAGDQSGKLQALVQQWKNSSGAARESILDTLIYQWAGVQNVPINSRGGYIDARQLTAVEKFLGSDFTRNAGNPSNAFIAQPLKQAYALFHTFISEQLYWQTDAPDLLEQLDLKWVDADPKALTGTLEATGRFEWDAKVLAETLHSRFMAGSTEDGVLNLHLFATTFKRHSFDNVLQALKVQAGAYTDMYGVLLLNMEGLAAAKKGTGEADNLTSTNASLLLGSAGNDTLVGSRANDVLIGGLGNDALNGDYGNDTYVFNQGDGQDTVYDYDYTAGNVDTLQLGTGLTANNTVIVRSGYDLTLSWGADSIRMLNYFSSDGYSVEKINFADGTQWGLTDIAVRLVQNGTGDSDNIRGFTNYTNRINGLGGNDYLYGGNKDDVLNGGDGNDDLSGYEGDDKLDGGAGNDSLYAGAGADVLLGGEGADTLSGGGGVDTLTGGTGNDYLDGGYGNDTYVFNLGDGSDTIAESDYTSGNVDILKLGAGLLASEVQISSELNDLKLSWGSDSVTLSNYFNGYSDQYRIEQISFADGTMWGIADIASKVTRNGSASSDFLNGLTNYTNRINGLGGNDYLYGGNKDDVLNGGDGSDYLNGGRGADQFIFDSLIVSGSVDTITDFSSSDGDVIALSSSQMTKFLGKSSLTNHFRLSGLSSQGDDDYLVYNRSTGELSYDASGNAGANAVVFAVLANKPQDISATQFVVL